MQRQLYPCYSHMFIVQKPFNVALAPPFTRSITREWLHLQNARESSARKSASFSRNIGLFCDEDSALHRLWKKSWATFFQSDWRHVISDSGCANDTDFAGRAATGKFIKFAQLWLRSANKFKCHSDNSEFTRSISRHHQLDKLFSIIRGPIALNSRVPLPHGRCAIDWASCEALVD